MTIGQEINETFLIETGLHINEYGKSYRIKGEGFGGHRVSDALVAYEMPISLKANVNLLKDKLSLVTTVG